MDLNMYFEIHFTIYHGKSTSSTLARCGLKKFFSIFLERKIDLGQIRFVGCTQNFRKRSRSLGEDTTSCASRKTFSKNSFSPWDRAVFRTLKYKYTYKISWFSMYQIHSNHIYQTNKFDIKNIGSLYVSIMHPILFTPKCKINYVNM